MSPCVFCFLGWLFYHLNQQLDILGNVPIGFWLEFDVEINSIAEAS